MFKLHNSVFSQLVCLISLAGANVEDQRPQASQTLRPPLCILDRISPLLPFQAQQDDFNQYSSPL